MTLYDYILVFTNRRTNKLTISGVQSEYTIQRIKEQVANLRADYREKQEEQARDDVSIKHVVLRKRRVKV